MNKIFFFMLCIVLSRADWSRAQAVDRPLSEIQHELYGTDYLHPSPDSLLGRYIAETGAATTTRRFWRAPDYSVLPPHELGPVRLVVAVSPQSFQAYSRYFGSKNYLHLLHEHGNLAAFEGNRSLYAERGVANWLGQYLGSAFTRIPFHQIDTPMIMSDSEGRRAEDFFELARLSPVAPFPDRPTVKIQGALARWPFFLRAAEGSGTYTTPGAFTACGTWIGNMPIGDELVDEYYASIGDNDGSGAIHARLKPYRMPPNLTAETQTQLRKVWTVPAHKQLSEILDSGANRRGEFDNAAWTSYTVLGSAGVERVPVVFYSVDNVTAPIPENFDFIVDSDLSKE